MIGGDFYGSGKNQAKHGRDDFAVFCACHYRNGADFADYGMESAVISMARGLVVLLVCIFVLPACFGMTGTWLAAPVTEAVTLCISFRMMWRET